jgi:hypothetical protein
MVLSKGPDWDSPARLDGLPVKNWTTREGATLCAPFSACVKRWLELHPSHRIGTSLGWGPNAEGHYGCWERPNIVGYLERNGPPPEMFGITIEHVRNRLAHDREPMPPLPLEDDPPPGHSVGGDNGEAVWKSWLERRRAKR